MSKYLWIIHNGSYEPTFKEWLYTCHPDVLCFVYHADEGYYGVQTTVDPTEEFRKSHSRKLFPEIWHGLRNEDLAFVSGLKSAFFCSDKGYIAGFWEKEDAIKAAEYIVRRQELLEAFNLE